jgi:uncharacterized protein (DUF1501 family)
VLQAGQLAIVQGVSYPNPSRSHFRSMATWHTGRLDPEEHKGPGWIGRGLDSAPSPPTPLPRGERGVDRRATALLVGSGPPPLAIRGRRSIASAIERPADFSLMTGADPRKAMAREEAADDLSAFVQRSMLDAYATADRLQRLTGDTSDSRYPATSLASRLRLIARLIKVGMDTRVYYTLQGGYDTHSAQLFAHSSLLFELSGAVKAFLDDLAAAKLAERVVVLIFSEFGRTVRENGSAGTDHGTAGPVFVAGPSVKGGLVGATPSLIDLDPKDGDLRRSLDFRQVWATVLDDWLELSSKEALGSAFEHVPILRG